MSSSLAKSETSKPPAERRRPYAPKRFIFNVPETTLKKADSEDNIDLVSTSEDHVYIPLDFAFPSPSNYQDAYNSVCEHITNIFNEIHKQLFADYNEIIQETIEAQNIQGPKDCLNFIKSTVVKLADNIQKSGRKGGINKEAKEYERLLQKSEAKVRDLIRNEQIYRISFDQYTIRHEETERVLIEFQYKLKDKRAKIETLTQENQKLSSLIQSKEEEIRSLISENQNPLSNPGLLTPHSESPLSPDHQTAKLKNLNLQNLKGLLSTSKGTPIDNVALTPESGGLNNPTKLSARVSSPASAMKTKSSLDRYGKSRSTATGPLTLKINTLDKPKEREGNKNRLEILTDRKRLDNSAEQKMNSSERNLDSFNFNLRAVPRKAPSTQLSLAEQPKKPNPRKLVRHETSVEDKSKMINSARLRPYDDSAAALFKVEASEDYEPYSAVLGRTAQKRRDEQRQIQSKREEYQLLNSSRQRVSGASKMRPVMADLEGDSEEKSPKLKHIMTRERQPAYGFSNKQNSSKERSPRPDASGSKTPQSNTVFVNIMLKKLNSQKVTTKKGLL